MITKEISIFIREDVFHYATCLIRMYVIPLQPSLKCYHEARSLLVQNESSISILFFCCKLYFIDISRGFKEVPLCQMYP